MPAAVRASFTTIWKGLAETLDANLRHLLGDCVFFDARLRVEPGPLSLCYATVLGMLRLIDLSPFAERFRAPLYARAAVRHPRAGVG